MSYKWKVTMPKGIPKPGKTQLTIAIKTSYGYRAELEAPEMPSQKAKFLWCLACADDKEVARIAALAYPDAKEYQYE